MDQPRLAMCNFIPDVAQLRETASRFGFYGIDWTFSLDTLPAGPAEEDRLLRDISSLSKFEIRYHCAFRGIDVGDITPGKARSALDTFLSTCRVVRRLGGRIMTIHIGLGRATTEGLSWEDTVRRLRELVEYARGLGITVCLENLPVGWSSRPDLFERLISEIGCSVTIDIGHARVSPTVESRQFAFEDFIRPHGRRILNAHVYHEERDDTHIPPKEVEDLRYRLDLLSRIPCTWWVLELREINALMATLRVVREYLESSNGSGGQGG